MEKGFITGYRYYYYRLPEQLKHIYTSIQNGLEARRMDFTFAIEKHNGEYPSPELIYQIYDKVLMDNPLIYHVNRADVNIYYSYEGAGRGRIVYRDFYSPSQRYLVKQQIYRRAEPILERLKEIPDQYTRLHEVYRHVITTLKYDRSFTREKTQKNLEALTIVAPLLRNTGVCTGYSQLFKFLCDQLGIDCFEVIGPADCRNGRELHCWNVVKLDGNFYHIDTTFDSGHYHATQSYSYRYFLRSDEFMQQDRQWDRSNLPVMASDHKMHLSAIS